MKCIKCEHKKIVSFGMDYKGKEKTAYICNIQPLVSEINPNTNTPYGYKKLYAQHLNRCSPSWCPLKNNR